MTKRGTGDGPVRVAAQPGRALGRHRRRRPVGDARRRQDVDERDGQVQAAGLPGPRWVSTHRGVAVRRGPVPTSSSTPTAPNDDKPYVFVTEDFGETWKSLKANLPAGSTRVLPRGRRQPEPALPGDRVRLLRVASTAGRRGRRSTETTAADGGRPRVRPADDGERLVVATHGRSLWVLDVTRPAADDGRGGEGEDGPVQPVAGDRLAAAATRSPFYASHRVFNGQNPPRGAMIDYVLARRRRRCRWWSRT